MAINELATPEIEPQLRPRHVAVAMDGNGRWAKARGLPRSEGHRAGADRLTELVEAALAIQLGHVSVYGFSTENWRRSPDEVANLMTFTVDTLRGRLEELVCRGVRVRWSGRANRLPRRVVRELRKTEQATAHNTALTLYLCVNYGGKAELADAAAAIAGKVASGSLRPEAIDEALLAQHLYQPGAPDVDLFLRPSGEQRTSNFLVWQLAFAEMVFMDVLCRLRAHASLAGCRNLRCTQGPDGSVTSCYGRGTHCQVISGKGSLLASQPGSADR